MSKRGNSIGHTAPNKTTEEQPMLLWDDIDESYPESLDNTDMENSKDMEDSFRFTRETEYQPPREKDQPIIISPKLPSALRLLVKNGPVGQGTLSLAQSLTLKQVQSARLNHLYHGALL